MSARRQSSQVEYAHAFGALVRRLRDERGLTQGQLGDMITMSGGNLSKIERGLQGPPPDEVIAAIAKALKVDRMRLLRAAGRAIDRKTFEEQVLSSLKLLIEQQRAGFERLERLDTAIAALARK